MRTLFTILLISLSTSLYAKMAVSEAMKKLSGEYQLIKGNNECTDIMIDLEKGTRGLIINHLDFAQRFTSPQEISKFDNLNYGTRNDGPTAFLTLKNVNYISGGDGYSGSLLSRYKTVIDYSINEHEGTLVVSTMHKGWSLLYSSCTESGFFDKATDTGRCIYKKVQD